MLLHTRKKPILPRTIPLSFMIFCLTVFSVCQTTDSQSSDDISPDQILFSRQHSFEERLSELNRREDALIAREAAISARESELVTLFSELLKEKKQLENQQIQLENLIGTVSRTNNPPASAPPRRTAVKKTQHPSNKATTAQNKQIQDDITILGGLEYIYLEPPGISLSARIDTGAQTSSLNALDMVEFERDGKPYIKFNILDPETNEKIEITRRVRGHTKIKKHKTESQRRPIVQLRVKLGNLDEQISFTLIDRSKFDQQVLIGRNFLRDLAVVDVSKEYTVSKSTRDSQQ